MREFNMTFTIKETRISNREADPLLLSCVTLVF
jgi:hypothetical protein